MIVAQMNAELRSMLWEALEELAPLTGERDNFAMTLRAAGGGVVSIVVPLPPLPKLRRPQTPTVDELASDNWLAWVCGAGGW